MRRVGKYFFLGVVAFLFSVLLSNSVEAKEGLKCLYTLDDGAVVEWTIGSRPVLLSAPMENSSIFSGTWAKLPSGDSIGWLGDNNYDECPTVYYIIFDLKLGEITKTKRYAFASEDMGEDLKEWQTLYQSLSGVVKNELVQNFLGVLGGSGLTSFTLSGVKSTDPAPAVCAEFRGSSDESQLNSYKQEIDSAVQPILSCASPDDCSVDQLEQYVNSYEQKSTAAKGFVSSLTDKYKGCDNVLSLLKDIGVAEDGISYEDKINEQKQLYLDRADLSEEDAERIRELFDMAADATFNYRDYNYDFGSEVELDCEGILGPDLINAIQEIFNWIGIIAPILLIIFGSMDFGKAVLADDNDALKKAGSNFLKRCIAAVLLFLLPFIIQWLFTILAKYTDIVVTNPLCNIK